jgi:ABC-type sugar transport system ATPase subunit
MASVSFKSATRLYPGGNKPAVDKLDLEIRDGEFLVLPIRLRKVHLAKNAGRT